MTIPVDIQGLDKSFGAFKALDGLDLRVEEGQVAGFLGPNGAGKSTTIRVLLGLLKADAGHVSLLGGDPWSDAVRLHRRLAYVPGDVALWPNLSGGEVIDLLARLRGDTDIARRDELIERFELDPRKKARTYSKGNRQKVALVAALSSPAELLILDEPTSGLDPLMESVFVQTIREAKDEGRSVLLSSHILSEVEKLCDTVTIIRKGVTVQSGSLEDLRHLTRLSVHAIVDGDPSGLQAATGVHDFVVDGDEVAFDVDHDHLDAVMRELSELGLRTLTSNPPSLEELFMRHYGDDIASEDVA